MTMGSPHLPNCKVTTWAEYFAEAGDPLPEGMKAEWTTGAVLVCAEGCPELERARAHGRKLAKERGW